MPFCHLCGDCSETLYRRGATNAKPILCKTCYDLTWLGANPDYKMLRARSNRTKYCIDCGVVIPHREVMTDNGPKFVLPIWHRCNDCQSKATSTPEIHESLKENTVQSYKWIDKHPDYHLAHLIVQREKESIIIIYECSCKCPPDKKHKHHYRYDRPREVLLLCPKCHLSWHSKLRRMHKTTPTITPTTGAHNARV